MWVESGIIINQDTVTQPITLTVSPSGQATGTFTLSGCGVSPTTHSGSGQTSYTATPSCTITITVPTDAADTRLRFSGGTTTTVGTCGSGTCTDSSITYYSQQRLSVRYTVTGGGSPTAPALTRTVLGASGTTTLTTTATDLWVDAGTSWSSTNPLTGSTSTVRWVASTGASGTTSAALSVNPNYQRQYLLTNSQALSVTRTNNGTSATVTSNTFVDASTDITVAATYSRTWTVTAARWIYDITAASIGIQLFCDQACSSIQYINSDPSNPYVSFTTASSATVQGFVPSQTNLVFSRVLNNGVANTGATFSSNILTETGASPHEWDFTDPTQTPSNPSPAAEETPIVTPGGSGGGPFVIQEEEPPPTEEEEPLSEDVRSTTGQGITAIILIVSIFVLVGLFLAGRGQPGMRQPSNKRAKPRRPSDTRPNMRRPKS